MIKYITLFVLIIPFYLTGIEPDSMPRKFEGTVKIDEIHFRGNTKTREKTLLYLLQIKPGDKAGFSDITEAVQALNNSELFQSLSWELQKEEGKQILVISMQEKWTTIPILLFKADDSVSQFYAGLVDFNFLGMNAYSRASYKGSKPSDSSPFEDITNEWVLEFDMPSLFSSPYGGRVYFERSEEDRSISEESSELESFTLNLTTLEVKAKKKILQNLTLDAGAVYADKSAGFHDGSDFNQNQLGIFAGGHLDETEVSDFRHTGSEIRVNAGFHMVTGGEGNSYFTLHSEVMYQFLWPLPSLHTALKLQYDVSSSEDLVNQPDLEAYLRGGSGRTFFDRQLAGFSTEFSWSPSLSDTFNLEFMIVADCALAGNHPLRGDDLSSYFRIGPALRLSSPYVAGVNLNANLVITEEGKTEVYLGMMSFL